MFTEEKFKKLDGTLIGVAIAVASAPAGVKLFGEEKMIFWRETASGHSRLAYYLVSELVLIYVFIHMSLNFRAKILPVCIELLYRRHIFVQSISSYPNRRTRLHGSIPFYSLIFFAFSKLYILDLDVTNLL